MAYETHDEIIKRLNRKKRIAKMKLEERKIRREIFKLRFPFKISIKFNKLIVFICIATIVSYTVAAILLQNFTSMEISPTLTTCVFAFFGTELMGLAGIKIMDTKFTTLEPTSYTDNTENYDDIDAVG